ncbi:response regulator [Geobacter sp. DSM 9736]|uniref:response regulator n=1 Tax=Geobacter sp. DSM 9736 TaxID=1277350 RepID=UPI000B512B3D|nr:response regulator [Geobacter sp. DSM 9736]SNB46565.1 CheY chemotaxis protein or a CheY-like REC (receiver) domain [Geobacter sp. DSM 9736]
MTGIRILLIEDNSGDAQLLSEQLEELGVDWTVQRVARVSTALTALADEPFDLVLMDLGLPDSNGIETLRRIREFKPDLPVVVLSGSSQEGLAEETAREGARTMLVKGRIEPTLLLRAVECAINNDCNGNEEGG